MHETLKTTTWPQGLLHTLSSFTSVGLWWLALYFALPQLQLGFTLTPAFAMASVVALGVLVCDAYLMYKLDPATHAAPGWLTAVRVMASVGMAWLGGYALTLQLYWGMYRAYRPSPQSKKHLQTFWQMLQANDAVLWTFVAAVLLLFALDNLKFMLPKPRHFKPQVPKADQQMVPPPKPTIPTAGMVNAQDPHLEHAYEQQLTTIAAIQHELGGKLPVVKNTLHDLTIALHQLADKTPGFNIDQKIREPLPGEPEGNIDSFRHLVTRMQLALTFSIQVVENIKHLVHADPLRHQPEELTVLSWIRQEMATVSHTKLIELSFDGPNLTMSIDRKQMRLLLNNVVDNARRHAFEAAPRPHLLNVAIEQSLHCTSLIVRNNGMGLPPDFDAQGFFEPGTHYGARGNSGLGGYLIGLVAKAHGAEAHLKPSSKPGFVTDFELKFS